MMKRSLSMLALFLLLAILAHGFALAQTRKVGRGTKGLARGPAFQLFDGSGALLVTQFVLNGDFSNVKALR